MFRDLRHRNADAEQFKAILAAEIIKAFDRERLTVRAAHDRTGIAATDFSRIRNADLGRFTLGRLMSILKPSWFPNRSQGARATEKSGLEAQRAPMHAARQRRTR